MRLQDEHLCFLQHLLGRIEWIARVGIATLKHHLLVVPVDELGHLLVGECFCAVKQLARLTSLQEIEPKIKT